MQAQALATLKALGGCLLAADVGWGKTLVALLAPRVLGLQPYECTYVVRAANRETFVHLARMSAEHFDIETRAHLVTYSELSRKPHMLSELAPKLLVLDEAHGLRNRKAARTKRFLRYIRTARPRVLAMSGTFAEDSIADYAHLLAACLGTDTPLPLYWPMLTSLALCVDRPSPYSWPGALDWATAARVLGVPKNGQDRSSLRARYQEYLKDSPGVVWTDSLSATTPVCVEEVAPEWPQVCRDAYERVRTKWLMPCGGEVMDPLERWRLLRQLSWGFYHRPIRRPSGEWYKARAALTRAVNGAMNNTPGTDSPGLILAQAHKFRSVELALAAWRQVEDACSTDYRVEWVDRSMLERVAENADGLIWYTHTAQADALEVAGLRTIRPGTHPPMDGRPMALSVRSHGTGVDGLQYHHTRNYVLSPAGKSAVHQQMIGRTARQGQTSPVSVRICTHTKVLKKALRDAQAAAKFNEETHNAPQLLLRTGG